MISWRENWDSRLFEDLAVEQFQIAFPKVLGAAEECRFGFQKTKARITPRLRQESFPRAGGSGFRLCQRVLCHNCGFGRNGGNPTI